MPSNVQFMTYADAAYVHWLVHLYRNMRLIKLLPLDVCTSSEASAAAAFALAVGAEHFGVNFVEESGDTAATRASTSRVAVAETFGTRSYLSIQRRKHACVLHRMEALLRSRGRASPYVLYVDADVTFLRDPRPHLPPTSAAIDLAALDDTGAWRAGLNAGFFAIRPLPQTLKLWRFLILQSTRRQLQASKTQERLGLIDEQRILNELLKEKMHGSVRHRALDTQRFLNGFRFYEDPLLRTNASSSSHSGAAVKLVAVHHNWIEGDAKKWQRAKAFGTLVLDANESKSGFLRRARSAMVSMPAWVPPPTKKNRRQE